MKSCLEVEVAISWSQRAVRSASCARARSVIRAIVVRSRSMICLPRSDSTAVIVVADDGAGIPAADQERIFERFTRLDEGRARGAGGAGLGLALVRAVAAAHGGSARVVDGPLGGARFELRLPL